MSEPAANPSLQIPNHDPRCHCELEPTGVPEGTTVVKGGAPGQPETRVALHADCPHHGPVARQIAKGASGYGISFGFGGPAVSEAALPEPTIAAYALTEVGRNAQGHIMLGRRRPR